MIKKDVLTNIRSSIKRRKKEIMIHFLAANTAFALHWMVLWTHSLLYNGGMFWGDVNHFHEGWFEVAMFGVIALTGIFLLKEEW